MRSEHANNPWATHTEILEALLNAIPIARCLEIGAGYYSTPLLVEKCGNVFSLELDKTWLDRVKAQISAANWHPILGGAIADYASFDLVVVDGDRTGRVAHANNAFRARVPLVVLHDTEKVRYYRWDLLSVPGRYKRYDFRCTHQNKKMTTVFTCGYESEVSQLNPETHERIADVACPRNSISAFSAHQAGSHSGCEAIPSRKEAIETISYLDKGSARVIIQDPEDLVQKTWGLGHFYETQRNGLLNYIAANYDGGSFIDCGAYIGNHTLFFHKVCHASRVYAFEPEVQAYTHLTKNLRLNGLNPEGPHGRALNLALGSRENGTAGLIYSTIPPSRGGSMMTRVNPSGKDTTITTLDAALEHHTLDPLTLIKIDCEGMGLEILSGAMTTIRKYRPDISIEAESGIEIIDALLEPLGYKREPFILNHTATYIYKPTQRIRLRLLITTYNRPDQLSRLLRQLDESALQFARSLGVALETIVDVWNDGGHKVAPEPLSHLTCHYHEQMERHGKQGYWRLIAKAYQILADQTFDYFVQLPDDVEIAPGFLIDAITQWSGIYDKQKISLNLLLDRSRVGHTNWTNYIPTIQTFGKTRAFLTQWNDLCFISGPRFFKALDYRINPISPRRWRKHPTLSSGVGQQISQRLVAQSLRMYQVRTSLVRHDDHLSVMNPAARCRVSLKSCQLDEIHCGVASYSACLESLQHAVQSIVNQVDVLHVYLNGCSSVPDFLTSEQIKVYLSEKHLGDLGDAGKFYMAGKLSGYYFSIDDDLIYPRDYVWSLIDKIELYKRRAVIGVHGRTMKPNVKSYYKDKARLFHCLKGLHKDQLTHVLGTGTTAFHSQTIRLRIYDFEIPNMADIWLAIAGQQQQVPFVTMARKEGWLKPCKASDKRETIYERFCKNDGVQTMAFNRVGEWRLNRL